MLPVNSNFQICDFYPGIERSGDKKVVKYCDSKDESPWDPAYLLFQEFGELCIEAGWLPGLSALPKVRKRLNGLVCDKQNEEIFHDWVQGIADLLKKEGYLLGFSYSIVGSSVPQVLGVEWLLSLTGRMSQECNKNVEKLRGWIQDLEFNRNDIDARLYVNLGKSSHSQATKHILSLFQNTEGHKAVGIPGIGVLVTRGNWDMFIRVSGRNHVFDADDAEIRIPFNLKGSDPGLKISQPTEFFHGLVFGRLNISDSKGINEHAWRVQVYRSICGKWAENASAVDDLYQRAAHLSEDTLKKQIKMSCKGHGMPKGSQKRHCFLLQIILEGAEKWRNASRSNHKIYTETVWSKALLVKNEKQMKTCLHWIALIAFRENWSAPFRARLSIRAGKPALRLDTDKGTIWLSDDPSCLKPEEENLWPMIRAVKWNDVKRGSPFDIPLRCIESEKPLMRFLDYRLNYPELASLNWQKIANREDKFENELLSQLIETSHPNEKTVLKLLPHSFDYTTERAIRWKLESTNESLPENWVQPALWEVFLKNVGADILHQIILRTPRSDWKELDESLRERVLDRVTCGSIRFRKKIVILKLVDAETERWSTVIHNSLTIVNCDLILSEGLQKLSFESTKTWKKIHDLALKSLTKEMRPSGPIKLLDRWIKLNDSFRALELWHACTKHKLLDNWKNSWALLLICREYSGKNLSALAGVCAKCTCPNFESWRLLAPKLIPQIFNNKVKQQLLLPVLSAEHPELVQLYIETEPPLDQLWSLSEIMTQDGEWTSHYLTLFPRLLEEKSVLWKARLLMGWLSAWNDKKNPAQTKWLRRQLEPLISDILSWPAIEVHECLKAFITIGDRENIPGIVGDLRLIWKALEGAKSEKEVFIPLVMWDKWINKIRLIPQSSQKSCLRILSRMAHGHADNVLRLLHQSDKKCGLKLPTVFCELMRKRKLSEREINAIFIQDTKSWIVVWINGLFHEVSQDKRLFGTCRLLKILLTYGSSNFDNIETGFLELISTCIKEQGLKAIHRLLVTITLTFERQPNIQIGRTVFSHIEKMVLKYIEPNNPKSEEVALVAATLTNFLLVDPHTLSSYGWKVLDNIGMASPVQFVKSYSSTLSFSPEHQWLNKISTSRKKKSDTFIKSVLLTVSVASDYGQADSAQLIRCYAELILQMSQCTDNMPDLKSTFYRWAKNTSYGVELALDTSGIQEALETFANFCLSVHSELPTKKTMELFLDMLTVWDNLKDEDAKRLLGESINDRLKTLNREEYSNQVPREASAKLKHHSSLYKSGKKVAAIGIGLLAGGLTLYPLHHFGWESMAKIGYAGYVGGGGLIMAGGTLMLLGSIEALAYKVLSIN